MKNYTFTALFFIAFALAGAFSSTARTTRHLKLSFTDTLPPVAPPAVDDKIFEKVEIEAFFSDNEDAWGAFLMANLKAHIPVKRKAPAGTYTVVAQFIVDKEGRLSGITTITNHGFGMEAEVVRVLKRSPRWKPAVQDGRKVKAYRRQPITFVISEE